MAYIPAICASCGSVFPSPFIFEGPASIIVKGCQAGPCPKCGGLGDIVDGSYQIIGDAVRLIVSSLRSRAQVEQLQNILRKAQQEKLAPQAVPEKIQAESPELSVIASWINTYLVPKNAGEFWTAIGAIGTVLALLYTILSAQPSAPSNALSEKQIEMLVEHAVTSALVQTQGASSAPVKHKVVAKRKNKTGRNDPCPCNSGKKYKICCINQTKPAS